MASARKARPDGDPRLQELGRLLDRQAVLGQTLTYREAARALDLPPPNTIHQLAMLLEQLMAEDVANGRPLRAALVVSRIRNGRPAPGFFSRARELGLFDGGDPEAFHDRLVQELRRDD